MKVGKPSVSINFRARCCGSLDPLQKARVESISIADLMLSSRRGQCLYNRRCKTLTKASWILLMSRGAKLSRRISPDGDVFRLQGGGVSMAVKVFAKTWHLVMKEPCRLSDRGSPLVLADMCQRHFRMLQKDFQNCTCPYTWTCHITRSGRMFLHKKSSRL